MSTLPTPPAQRYIQNKKLESIQSKFMQQGTSDFMDK